MRSTFRKKKMRRNERKGNNRKEEIQSSEWSGQCLEISSSNATNKIIWPTCCGLIHLVAIAYMKENSHRNQWRNIKFWMFTLKCFMFFWQFLPRPFLQCQHPKMKEHLLNLINSHLKLWIIFSIAFCSSNKKMFYWIITKSGFRMKF